LANRLPLTQSTEGSSETKKEDEGAVRLEDREVKKRLRSLRQPITLFGETVDERWERLRKFELSAKDRSAAGYGSTNTFRQIMEEEVKKELLEAQAAALEKEKGHEVVVEKKVSKYETEKQRSDFDNPQDFILYFLKRMLYLWKEDLDQRPDAQKMSGKGKIQTATQKQTRHNMKPLFRMLKVKETPADVEKHLEKIVLCCMDRDYAMAQEHYLTLAIGNAAWPIGVTMVGIHERSGREKIFAQHQAHVLNDETQRKYIQGVKRLMTYAREKFPGKASLQ